MLQTYCMVIQSDRVCCKHIAWLYLFTTEGEEISAVQEIERLVECDPDEIPQESKFLLEMDFQTLYNSSFKKQSYWVRAMKAARRAGRRAVA